MKGICIIFAAAAVLALARAQVSIDPNDPRFDRFSKVYPSRRHARDVTVDRKSGTVSGQYPAGGGNIFGIFKGDEAKFGYRRNIFDNNHGKLDGSAYHGRVLGANGDSSSLGGRLDFTGDRGTASLDVSRFNHGPTYVQAAGGAKWPISKTVEASLQGTYGQVVGQGRPDVGVLATVEGTW